MSVVEARLTAIEARLAALETGGGKAAANGKGGKIADDKTFQGAYGNPEIRIDPKAWDGPSLKGQKFSDAPVEWLELAATMYDAFGDKATAENKTDANGKPVAWRDYQRASLARRWAQEKNAEGPPKSRPVESNQFDADESGDLPF